MQRILPLSVLAAALTWAAQPDAAQDADACRNEVQRLAESFSLAPDGQMDAAIAQEPSARKGAELGNEQRRQIGELVRAAREAGERGDGASCLQRLGEARLLLRQAGIGSGQPGSATLPGGATTPGGGGTQGLARGTTTLPGGNASGTAGTGATAGGAMVGDGGLNSGSTVGRGRTGGGPQGVGAGGLTGGTVGAPTNSITGGVGGLGSSSLGGGSRGSLGSGGSGGSN
jgi:hypothetical protein